MSGWVKGEATKLPPEMGIFGIYGTTVGVLESIPYYPRRYWVKVHRTRIWKESELNLLVERRRRTKKNRFEVEALSYVKQIFSKIYPIDRDH